jgi:hypothetical protein
MSHTILALKAMTKNSTVSEHQLQFSWFVNSHFATNNHLFRQLIRTQFSAKPACQTSKHAVEAEKVGRKLKAKMQANKVKVKNSTKATKILTMTNMHLQFCGRKKKMKKKIMWTIMMQRTTMDRCSATRDRMSLEYDNSESTIMRTMREVAKIQVSFCFPKVVIILARVFFEIRNFQIRLFLKADQQLICQK